MLDKILILMLITLSLSKFTSSDFNKIIDKKKVLTTYTILYSS